MFHNDMIKIFIITLFGFTSYGVNANETIHTAEYLKLRSEVYKQVNMPYRECMDKVGSELYKKAYDNCKKEGKGKDVGGGCAHIASYATAIRENEPNPYEHCNTLKATRENFISSLKKAAKSKGIRKYKK